MDSITVFQIVVLGIDHAVFVGLTKKPTAAPKKWPTVR